MREYFRRRFGYESAGYPSFEELTRDDDLDIEVACSGFTKEMERDILQEYGMESFDEDDDEDVDDSQNVKASEENDSKALTDTELNALRKQVDHEMRFAEEKNTKLDNKSAIQKYIESMTEHLANATFADDVDVFQDAIDDSVPHNVGTVEALLTPATNSSPVATVPDAATQERDADSTDDRSIHSNEPEADDDELADLDPTSRAYRFKMVEKILSDARSQRSYSTTASTIAPSVIKDRIKKTTDIKKQLEVRKRCVAKGEASAITRKRNENRDTCKEYAGWDF